MSERVVVFDLGVRWDPNAPMAMLLTDDYGRTALALNAHFDDADQRCVVLVWSETSWACLAAPNDEALSGHRLYKKGLGEVHWAGVVRNSKLMKALERQNRVHPQHDPSGYAGRNHYVLPLKERVAEVVAHTVMVRRLKGTTVDAVNAALRE